MCFFKRGTSHDFSIWKVLNPLTCNRILKVYSRRQRQTLQCFQQMSEHPVRGPDEFRLNSIDYIDIVYFYKILWHITGLCWTRKHCVHFIRTRQRQPHKHDTCAGMSIEAGGWWSAPVELRTSSKRPTGRHTWTSWLLWWYCSMLLQACKWWLARG